MSYELEGRLSVKIMFRDREFPFTERNSLEFLHMSSCPRLGIPMMHFAVSDVTNFFEETGLLSDGIPISIAVGVPAKNGGFRTSVYNFRMNSFKRGIGEGSRRFEFDGYLNFPEYWHNSSHSSLRGTSAAVLRKIAEQCFLKFEGSSTADPQVWFPRNRPYHQWARDIASRAYRSETSCMQLALDLTGCLLFRDINEEVEPSVNIALATPREGYVLAVDFAPQTFSGSLNHLTGYASQRIEQDLGNPNVHVTHSNVQVSKRSREGALLVNKDVHKKVVQSRVRFAPISPGNVHPAYEKAYYQNLRLANLFSSGLEVLLAEPSNARLLDVVGVHLDSPESYVNIYSGGYRVVSRTIYIQGTTYYEKLGLARRGLTGNLPDSF